ncbi:LysE family translocator [Sulfurospirillum barnesii]|uniref:Putative threonine efflux protein n=1 Tax=Sulfurospirillum barnesii (strain ATCC 700032 / DSM 10660 / SES-3) TaxID=760154 RepID=I3XYS6_SULBS|nr:LysE family translocator [Sulfurospirillum barnesii]AFL69100.1 putative threonine efflux protein [Sulfurospirillum barnesii SES-3]
MFGSEFLTLTSIYFLALLSPGQDFFLIMKHALTHGYQKAWWVCLGVASGNAFYITLAYMGHHALTQFPIVMVVIEAGGACFLLYLGILLLLSKKQHVETSLHVKTRLASKLFFQGLFSALLNPKNILFYFSLLFTIIKPEQLLHVKIFYAFWMIGLLLLWDGFVAFLFGNTKALKLLPYVHYIQKMIGVFFILFALHLFVTGFAK